MESHRLLHKKARIKKIRRKSKVKNVLGHMCRCYWCIVVASHLIFCGNFKKLNQEQNLEFQRAFQITSAWPIVEEVGFCNAKCHFKMFLSKMWYANSFGVWYFKSLLAICTGSMVEEFFRFLNHYHFLIKMSH